MKARLQGLLKFVLYPAFYLFCLSGFVYLTFPWDRVRERIEAEFARQQASKGADAWRLEIAELDGYWLSGVELHGVKLVIPPSDDEDDAAGATVAAKGPMGRLTSKKPAAKKSADDDASGGDDAKDDKAKGAKKPKESVILVEEAHARVRLLPLLIGRVRVDFEASVFGGSVHGTVPVGTGDLEIELESVDLAQIAPIEQIASVPVKGVANGRLELAAQNGKWSKASGALSMTVTDMVLGDGKAKFRNLMALPPAQLGTFEIEAKADAGVLKIEKFGATGKDVEISGEGTVKLKEPWDGSAADLWVRFGFSDDYKNKDDRTKALFVDDGPFPALISQDRKLKRAKRADGLWGFHVHGRLGRLRYDPTTADGPKGKASSQTESPTSKKKSTKKASAKDDDDDDVAKEPAKPKLPVRSPTPTPEPAEPAREPSREPSPEPTPEAARVEPPPAPPGAEEAPREAPAEPAPPDETAPAAP